MKDIALYLRGYLVSRAKQISTPGAAGNIEVEVGRWVKSLAECGFAKEGTCQTE